jgi:glucokinase
MILAGDIGGTKTVLALFEAAGTTIREVRSANFPSQDHATFAEILAAFLKDSPNGVLSAGCFGAAGPVLDGKVQTTNLPWRLEERDLARALGTPRVKLLNDLEAMAYGMLHLRADELTPLNPAAAPRRPGNVAVIAAGTGLGEAMLYWDGQRHHPLASEGGHADFAPHSDLQIELLRYLRGKHDDHVSWERVLSGPGFWNCYTFLRDMGYYPEQPWLTEELKTGDPSARATQIGLSGADPLCGAALELFSELYGAEAGNLALKCVALGGVFVGGGIAPKMLSVLQNGSFLRGFKAKGRFTAFMSGLQVYVALNPRTPLLGAAHFALRLAG